LKRPVGDAAPAQRPGSYRSRSRRGDSEVERMARMVRLRPPPPEYPKEVGFRWYQLFTHQLLHGGIMHLAGNLLFLLVFGLRVNELVGNLKMAILYPLLGAMASAVDIAANQSTALHPSLGASGAIMGLAGMYFVFFPVQKVRMAIWFRGGILTGWQVIYKVFSMRGFWLLVLWVGLPWRLHVRRGAGGRANGVAAGRRPPQRPRLRRPRPPRVGHPRKARGRGGARKRVGTHSPLPSLASRGRSAAEPRMVSF
jgi:membrane associated rhomboid family serine protease